MSQKDYFVEKNADYEFIKIIVQSGGTLFAVLCIVI